MTGGKRLTRRTALALVAAGGTVAGAETLGFTNVTGTRDVDINTADDPIDALLGIDAEADIGELTANDGTVQVAELINNLENTIDVIDVVVEAGDDGVLTASADPQFGIPSAGTSSAMTECESQEAVGQRDVTFGVTAESPSVSITDVQFTVTVDIQCQKGTVEPSASGLEGVFVSDLEDNVTAQEQTYEFRLTADLPAGESVEIVLDRAIGGNSIDFGNATFETDSPGTVTGRESGKDYVVAFTADEALDAGVTVSITATGVNTTGNTADGVYDAFFRRSDFDAEETTQFEVA